MGARESGGTMIEWVKQPDTTCPAGWIVKEERAILGRFALRVLTVGREGKVWAGNCPGVCMTGDYDAIAKAKAALLKLVRKELQKALAELDETPTKAAVSAEGNP